MKNNKRITDKYIDVVYSEEIRPFTSYPLKLSSFLIKKYKISPKKKLLDIGCGRGEFLNGFIENGIEGYGVDRVNSVSEKFSKISFKKSNIEEEGLPYEDESFDIVFSKSVIEHFYDPSNYISEAYRVLKKGGLLITMCPSWEYNYRIYFEDFTHRSPFMLESLRDIQLMVGLKEVEVEFFHQLPIVWRLPFIKILSFLTRIFLPRSLSKYSKWVRFSKEIMLLSTSRK